MSGLINFLFPPTHRELEKQKQEDDEARRLKRINREQRAREESEQKLNQQRARFTDDIHDPEVSWATIAEKLYDVEEDDDFFYHAKADSDKRMSVEGYNIPLVVFLRHVISPGEDGYQTVGTYLDPEHEEVLIALLEKTPHQFYYSTPAKGIIELAFANIDILTLFFTILPEEILIRPRLYSGRYNRQTDQPMWPYSPQDYPKSFRSALIKAARVAIENLSTSERKQQAITINDFLLEVLGRKYPQWIFERTSTGASTSFMSAYVFGYQYIATDEASPFLEEDASTLQADYVDKIIEIGLRYKEEHDGESKEEISSFDPFAHDKSGLSLLFAAYKTENPRVVKSIYDVLTPKERKAGIQGRDGRPRVPAVVFHKRMLDKLEEQDPPNMERIQVHRAIQRTLEGKSGVAPKKAM